MKASTNSAEMTIDKAETEKGEELSHEELIAKMHCAADEAAELLRCIGSPYRLLILCHLMESEKTVSEICEAIGARQSLTSQHLTRLRLDGLVQADRRGHYVFYSLTDSVAKDIVSTLYRHYCSVDEGFKKSDDNQTASGADGAGGGDNK